MTRRSSAFDRFARWTAWFAGDPMAFAFAAALIGLSLVSGPLFGFNAGSDTGSPEIQFPS